MPALRADVVVRAQLVGLQRDAAARAVRRPRVPGQTHDRGDVHDAAPARRIMPLMMAARVVANAESRSVLMRSSQSGGDIWMRSLSRTAPALFTSTSTRPIAFIIDSTWAGSPTSAWYALAWGSDEAVSSAEVLSER